jgi:tRNA nucleotidyltransferase (CCA-adding enzyme)
VRILRLARFAARFADFSVAPETLALMRGMVADGEVDALVPERVWQELARGLMESRPSRMVEVLRECGALARLLPELGTGGHLLRVLDMSARLAAPLAVRFACLAQGLGPDSTPAGLLPHPIGHEGHGTELLKSVCERLRVPVECRELADVVVREHGDIHRSAEFGAAALVRLLERCDALRKPQRFAQVLLACECDARARPGCEAHPYPPRERLLAALAAAQSVATQPIAQQAQATGASGRRIGELIQQARIEAVARAGVAASP